ncbi:MAG: diguanylate cyclase [Chloroflexota bacterium]|nr:diguanylate cyclase [Chloroflexota bacterium]
MRPRLSFSLSAPTRGSASGVPASDAATPRPVVPIERGMQIYMCVFAGSFLFWLLAKPGGETALTWFSDVALSVTAIAGGLGSLLLSWTLRGPDRRGWLFISAGVLSWGLGQAVWSYYELIAHRAPFPSGADVGYLGMIPLMLTGVALLPAARDMRGDRLKVGLDALIVMTALVTVGWYAVLGPIYTSADSTWTEKIILLAYPAGDVLLMCGLVGGFARGWIARGNVALVPLIAGIVLFIVADFGFAFLTVNEAYASGDPIDIGWPLGFLFVTYAVIRRKSHGLTTAGAESVQAELPGWLDSVRVAAPYILVAAVGVLIFASRAADRGMQSNIFMVAALATVFLVVLRQFITMNDNARLNRKLRSFHQLVSSLSAAASTGEVCAVGLGALRQTVGGFVAVLYLRQGDDYTATASDPPGRLEEVGTVPKELLVPHNGEVIVRLGEHGLNEIWVPLTARGQTRGLIAMNAADLGRAIDTETLTTIGSEIGVCFENQRRFEEARELADHDSVTGLYNPRYFHTQIEEFIQGAESTNGNLGLIVLDIDDFKLFNDTFGHAAGDHVLQTVAAGLRGLEPPDGFSARLGGDEFAVVLPHLNRGETIEFAQGVQRWCNEQAYVSEGGERVPIRLTFGFSNYPEQGTRRFEIVAAADATLYEAKHSGGGLSATIGGRRVTDAARASGTFGFLEALVTSVDNKDKYTKRHCDLVSEYAQMIGEGLGLSEESQRSLVIAGALHDVGKICVPDRILRKPTKLTKEEYEIMKMHVPLAANLIQQVPRRRDVLDAVLHHHERFDGTGYVKGLKGDRIPLLGRIMAVADAFSAMTLDRHYRKALPLDLAIAELRAGAGTQFDPQLVDVFIAQMERKLRGGLEAAA